MQVKIIWIDSSSKSTGDAEKRLEDAMSKGWRVIAAGGGGPVKEPGCLGLFSSTVIPSGFVILAKANKS